MKQESNGGHTELHQELEATVRKLANAEEQFKQKTDAVRQLQNEIDKRTAWAQLLEKEFAERTALALRLNGELDQMKAAVGELETALKEVTWARRVDRRIQKFYGYGVRLIRYFRKWFRSSASLHEF
jgi:chromosome segregation ATPase